MISNEKEELNSDIQTVNKNVVWSFLSIILNVSLKYISLPLLINYFGKDQYGLFSIIVSLNVALGLLELGLNSGLVKFISIYHLDQDKEKIKKLVQSFLSIFSGIGVINGIVLLIIAFYFNNVFVDNLEQSIIFKVMVIPLSIISILIWTFSVLTQSLIGLKLTAFEERLIIIREITQFFIIVFTINLKLSLEQYFLLYSLCLLLPIPFRYFKVKSIYSNLSLLPSWNWEIIKPVLSYSSGIFLLGFFHLLIQNSKPLIVGILMKPTNVTDFRILEQIISIITRFSGVFLTILLPFTSQYIHAKKSALLENLALKGTLYVSILITMMVFGLITISEEFITLYLGEEFIYLNQWLIVWALFMLGNHNIVMSAIILGESSFKSLTIFAGISTIFALILAWFLTKKYGVGGVIIANGVYIVLHLVFYYFYYFPTRLRINSGRIFLKSFLHPVLIGIIGYSTTKYMFDFVLPKEVLSRLILKGLTFFIIYFVLIISQKLITYNEICTSLKSLKNRN